MPDRWSINVECSCAMHVGMRVSVVRCDSEAIMSMSHEDGI